MKPFNLEEYLKNPSQKVVTRDGKEVRIICTDAKSDEPIVALLYNKNRDEENVYTYNRKGRCFKNDSYLDLFFAPIKREGWVNVYSFKDDTRTIGCLFSSEEEAIKHKLNESVSSYIKTIKIEWEE